MTSHQESHGEPDVLFIDGCSHPTVIRYFETLNAGDFEQTAALFAEEGALLPPFEEPVVGPEAIARYLQQEAVGMRLKPRTGVASLTETGETQFEIKGKVQTSVFGVNVGWLFLLTPANTLQFVRVKLLASPQELLNLRR